MLDAVLRRDVRPRDDAERKSLKEKGVTEAQLGKVYTCDDLAKGNRILFARNTQADALVLDAFAATG